MKVLLVIDSLGPGGAQRQLTALATGLAARGHDISLLTYHPELDHFRQKIISAHVKIIDVVKKNRFSLMPALEIRRYVKAENIDAVVSFLDVPNIYSILGTARLRNVKLVVSERSSFSTGHVSLAKRMLYFMYRSADAVTVNSHYQMNRIDSLFPAVATRTSVIYNTLDLNEFCPSGFTMRPSKGVVKVLSIASLQKLKNAKNLIKAVSLCRDRGLAVNVSWVGRLENSDEVNTEFSGCKDLIRDLKIQDRWEWMGVKSNIAELIRESDAVIHPSFFEGLPNVVCEAMASGKVVLAGNVCEHPYLLGEGRGILFNPSSAECISPTCRMRPFAQLDDQGRSVPCRVTMNDLPGAKTACSSADPG